MNNHFHNIPTVLEGESLYEAYCKLLQYVKNIETETAAGKVSKTGDTMTGELLMSGADAKIVFGGLANNSGIRGLINPQTNEGSLVITGVKAPTAISDAATKGYVDTADTALQSSITALTTTVGTKIGAAGGTISQGKLEMTGALSGLKFNSASSNGIEGYVSTETGVGTTKITGIRNPVDAYDAATKEYVDAQVGSGKVSKTGDSMTGMLTMTGSSAGIQFYSGNTQGIKGAVSTVTGAGLTEISGVRAPVNAHDAATKKYVDDNAVAGQNKVSKSGDNVWGPITFQENPGVSSNDPKIVFTATANGIQGYASPQTGAGLTPITNIRMPVNDYDVATKKYVDQSSQMSDKVSKTGDTMTGTLNMTEHNIDQVGILNASSVNASTVTVPTVKVESISLPTTTEEEEITVSSNVRVTGDQLAIDTGKISFSQGSYGIKGYTHPTQGGQMKVEGVRTPTNDYDASTKKYVDDNVANKIDITTGLTADLNAANHKISSLGTPTFNYDAATKKYVDDTAATKLDKTGGSITGNLIVNGDIDINNGDFSCSSIDCEDINTHNGTIDCGDVSAGVVQCTAVNVHNGRVQNVATPTVNTDAATKKYVDDTIASNIPMIINATKTGNTWTCDKTLAEIVAHSNSIVVFTDGGYTYRAPIVYFSYTNDMSHDIGWRVVYGGNATETAGYEFNIYNGSYSVANWNDT